MLHSNHQSSIEISQRDRAGDLEDAVRVQDHIAICEACGAAVAVPNIVRESD